MIHAEGSGGLRGWDLVWELSELFSLVSIRSCSCLGSLGVPRGHSLGGSLGVSPDVLCGFWAASGSTLGMNFDRCWMIFVGLLLGRTCVDSFCFISISSALPRASGFRWRLGMSKLSGEWQRSRAPRGSPGGTPWAPPKTASQKSTQIQKANRNSMQTNFSNHAAAIPKRPPPARGSESLRTFGRSWRSRQRPSNCRRLGAGLGGRVGVDHWCRRRLQACRFTLLPRYARFPFGLVW